MSLGVRWLGSILAIGLAIGVAASPNHVLGEDSPGISLAVPSLAVPVPVSFQVGSLAVPVPVGSSQCSLAVPVQFGSPTGLRGLRCLSRLVSRLVPVPVGVLDWEHQSGDGYSGDPVRALHKYLQRPFQERPPMSEQSFFRAPLTKTQAREVRSLLVADHRAWILRSRSEEMGARVVSHGDFEMPFWYKVYGEPNEQGRSLYLSLHGGGGAPRKVNDRQWENQKRLYTPAEGVYLAPRAPTDTWNLWHQEHIDPLFDRLIENLIVFEKVDSDRVYLMGYSAGGDGVFQLAPRMADRFAAASMMAGHPNETSPRGLRNLPFSLHVGSEDRAYRRNELGREWQKKLAVLRAADPEGYVHWAKIYQGKGHWMDREDAAAVEWMAKFTRNRFPEKIVWRQDDVVHTRFYWLTVPVGQGRAGSELIVRREGQVFVIEKAQVEQLGLLLNDEFVDLDRPIQVWLGNREVFSGKVDRTIESLHRTLVERGDPKMVFSAGIEIELHAD